MRTSILTLCLLLAPVFPAAQAQPGAEPGAGALFDRIASARLALERLSDAEAAVRARRDETARRHEALAADIRARKLARGDGRLLPDLDLQQLLSRSQDLSQGLTLLNRELAALRHARRERLEQLALAYDALIAQTTEQARAARGQRRVELLAVLAQARREGEAVRLQLAPAPVAPRELGAEVLASDDPLELGEQADAVRDEQDRLRRELARLDQQIQQRRGDARLDREMRDFVSDQEIFDEGSRLVVVPRSPTAAPAAAQDGKRDDIDSTPGGGVFAGAGEGAGSDAQAEGALAPAVEPLADRPPGRLPAGLSDAGAPGDPAGEGALSLEQRRAQIIDRLKQLQLLHDQLQEKIEDLASD